MTNGSQGGPWPSAVMVDSTGSTNADVLALARADAPEGTMVVALEQTAGRGRLDRSWESAPAAGLWCSVLARPRQRSGLLPLAAAVAAAQALRSCGVPCAVKWPNDLVVDGPAHDGSVGPRKVGGILAEADRGAVVIGIGINLAHGLHELPVARATSVSLEGGNADRDALLSALRRELRIGFDRLAAGGDVLGPYRAMCLTLGRTVTVHLPDGSEVSGVATRVLDDGRLEVDAVGDLHVVAAGDVIHATI